MLPTVLTLLVVLAAPCIVLWVIGRAVAGWVQLRISPRDATAPREGRAESSVSHPVADSAVPYLLPPGAMLLCVESVPISQAGNAAPMLRTGTITGTARWYRAALSYPEVAE